MLSKKFGVPYEQMQTPEERNQKAREDISNEVAKKEQALAGDPLSKLMDAP
jgi:hypothetical protein